ncbi:MAG: beta-propeller fold lactonase family protein, partial [Bryobacteraceae bacterium]
SNEAINIPPIVRVIQNSRNAEAVGDIMQVNVGASAAEGLVDIVSDTVRQRVYVANSGMNQVEVFDMRTKTFLSPIKVGQLPRSLALTPDGNTLYVANTGGESISIIDLDKGQVTGKVKFPALPYNASTTLITPNTVVSTLRGLQIVMSNGSLWKTVNNEAIPRPTNGAVGTAATVVMAPRTMIATPGGEFALLLGGDGRAYLYDSNVDEYVIGQTVVTTPIQGYFGTLAAGPRGQYFIVNDKILNQSLTPVGTSGPVVTATRPISTLVSLNANTYLRFVQPTRASTTAAVTTTPTIEMVDVATGLVRSSMPALEGPLTTQTGTQRVNVSARMMAVDATGSTAYVLTTSGLSVVPLDTAPVNPQSRPAVNPNGIVNLGSYLPDIAPGSIVSIFGRNLGTDGQASTDPLPMVLGGSCITLDNAPLPIFMTSTGQVNLQIPNTTTAGRHSLVIRSVDQKVATAATNITVVKYAPAILVNTATLDALIFHDDGTPVNKSHPAKRDEPIVMYAIGLGPTKGATIATGKPTPASPLSVTDKAEVFFGDPTIKEAGIIVDWSGLVPGSIGLYQLNLRVPGAHLRGDALPAIIRIGGVDSAKTGPAVPHIAVD